jgi:hypothetical protein
VDVALGTSEAKQHPRHVLRYRATMNCAASSATAKERQSGTRCWICGATGALHWKDRSIQRPLEPEDLRITDYPIWRNTLTSYAGQTRGSVRLVPQFAEKQ